MAKVLVAGPIHPDGMALLEARDDVDYEALDAPGEDELAARAVDADGIVLRITAFRAAAIAAARNLQVVSRHGVGYDNVDVDALTARRIPLTVVGDVNAVPVAEHTMALLLAAVRRIAVHDRAVRDGNYGIRNGPGQVELDGKTIVIVGYGRVGRRVARRCAAFDMSVIVADPYVDRAVVEADGYRHVADFRDVLDEADFVTLHMPGNADASPIVGAVELGRMKAGAHLINAARGTLIDEAALHRALMDGSLAGAALDVTRDEPPTYDLPLLQLENVTFTPHCASLTAECKVRMGVVCVQNVLDALDGRLDPAMVVNREVLD